MSLRGLIRRHGSSATLHRATRAHNAAGAATQSWAAVGTVRVLLDVPDAAVVQRIFGEGVRCDLRAIVDKTVTLVDTAGGQGLSITGGWRAGEHYDIARVMDFDQGRAHAHYELALVRRPGGFS